MSAGNTTPAFSVLLLSGGRGQRMGGQDKGLVPWRDKPMIAWAAQVVRTLTDDLIISCNRNTEQYAAFADRLVRDEQDNFPGPLAGIRAALKIARHRQLLVLPCDAPEIDQTLILELIAAANGQAAMVRQGEYWQPLFCVIPTTLRDDLEQAWRAGQRSPQRWLSAHHPAALDLPAHDARLSNINSVDMLKP